MPVLKKIKENLRLISYIEMVARVYQESAKMKMNQIRENVLRNREFIDELLKVYFLIKSGSPVSKKKIKVTKKKRILVFLSSNERFYGNLILDIWKEVEKFFKDWGGDLAIVGRMGKYLAEKSGFKEEIYYFDLDDERPEIEKIKDIVEFLKNYEEILVFHGRFHTVLTQKVTITNISGKEIEEKRVEKKVDYLFEPSPEEILKFFEEELIFSFFNQCLWEHQLSRYATRMVGMYQAEENAKKLKNKLLIEEMKIKREINNKKQIEQFSQFQLWS
jgi:F-type H+-transporting ATPase subunit gamma